MFKALKDFFRGQRGVKPVKPVLHPGLLRKAQESQSRPHGIGVVYGADGRPKIDAGFLRSLTYHETRAVEANLKARGWRINGDTVEKI